MPRALTRPTEEEITALTRFIRISSPKGPNRWRAVAVESWAKGKTTRDAAKEANTEFKEAGEPFRGNQTAVVRAINLYRHIGVDAFRTVPTRPRGRAPVPAEKVAAAVALLKQSIAKGTPLTYAVVGKSVGMSKAAVGRLAKEEKLDSKHRRGKVAKSVT